jgi:Arm DNA-binding domain
LNAGTLAGISSAQCGYISKSGLEGIDVLTDTEIKKARKREKPYKLSDGGGLYLWITPSGGKLWRWAHRYEKKEKLMTFGRYPEVSLAVARERHLEARKSLAAGVDPMAERKARKIAERVANDNSFASLAERVRALAAREKCSSYRFRATEDRG